MAGDHRSVFSDHTLAMLNVTLMIIGQVENKQIIEIKGFFISAACHEISRFLLLFKVR
tara:strand:- start:58906 stop:59079 length:174 start_codon:yes stop_codon:yes gene_type:complete